MVMPGAYGDRMRALDPPKLKLELQTVVNHCVVLGIRPLGKQSVL